MRWKLVGDSCLCFFYFAMLLSYKGFSQVSVHPRFQFRDSLVGLPDSYFLYTTVHADSTMLAEGASFVQLVAPSGWKIVGASLFDLAKPAFIQGVLPVTLFRTRFASAAWRPLQLQVLDSTCHLMIDTFLLVRGPTITDFQIHSSRSQVELADSSHTALLDLRIQNLGTTNGFYQLIIEWSGRKIVEKQLGSLLPGADTIYTLSVPIPSYSNDQQYRLLLQIKDSTGLLKTMPMEVFRRYTVFKFHPSRYSQFPLTAESGSFLVDKQLYSYIGAQSTNLLKEGSLSFSFRSKTFGALKTVEKNVFTFNLDRKKIFLSGGQLAESQHFYAYGSGLQLTYRIKSAVEIGFKGILHRASQTITNNNFQISFRKNKSAFSFTHQMHFDSDARHHLMGYLFFNEMTWKKSTAWFVKANLGTGFEQFRLQQIVQPLRWGWGGSVNLGYHQKKWEFNGEFRYHQHSYPGLNKGFRSHFYDFRRGTERGSWGVFYQYNFSMSPLLTDTIYRLDAFTFNIQKCGVRASMSGDYHAASMSMGALQQTALNVSQLPRYTFAELQYQWRSLRNLSIQLNAISGFASKKVVNQFAWFTNSSVDLKWNQLGIRGFYTQTPVLKDSAIKVLARYSQTLLLNPYLNLQLFKKVRTTLRYTVSKSLYDNRVIQGLGFSFFYRNGKGDWQLQCSGSVPLSTVQVNTLVPTSYSYIMLSVRKDFSVPLFFKKRYHQVNVKAFEDKNANNRLDADEQGLPQLHFLANKTRFVTDSAGLMQLKNVDTGSYTISVEAIPEKLGLVPAAGEQNIHISKATTILFPLRKGNAVSGQVKIERDPYSTKKYTAENILINIVEDGGEKFTTITDSTGHFYKILPAGRYTISLNKDAFTGSLRPVQDSFVLDLMRSSFGSVEFVLRERKREIRFKGDY